MNLIQQLILVDMDFKNVYCLDQNVYNVPFLGAWEQNFMVHDVLQFLGYESAELIGRKFAYQDSMISASSFTLDPDNPPAYISYC